MKNFFKGVALSLALCAPQAVDMFVGTVQAAENSIQELVVNKACEVFSSNVANQINVEQHSWFSDENSKNSLDTCKEIIKSVHNGHDMASQDKFFETNCNLLKQHIDDKETFLSVVNALMFYKSYRTLVYNKKEFEQKFLQLGKSGEEEYLKFLFKETYRFVKDEIVRRNGTSAIKVFKQLDKKDILNDWTCYCLQTNLLSGSKKKQAVKNTKEKREVKKAETSIVIKSVVDEVYSYEEKLMRSGKLVQAFDEASAKRDAKDAFYNKCRPLVESLERDLFTKNNQQNVDDVVNAFTDYSTYRNQYSKDLDDGEMRFDDLLSKFVINWLDSSAVINQDEDTFDSVYMFELMDAIKSDFTNSIGIEKEDLTNEDFKYLFRKLFNTMSSFLYFDKNESVNTKQDWLFAPDELCDSVSLRDMIVKKKDLALLKDICRNIKSSSGYSIAFSLLHGWQEVVLKKLKAYTDKRPIVTKNLKELENLEKLKEVKGDQHYAAQVNVLENSNGIKKYLLQWLTLKNVEDYLQKTCFKPTEDNEFSLF